eukprot:gene11440-4514_t
MRAQGKSGDSVTHRMRRRLVALQRQMQRKLGDTIEHVPRSHFLAVKEADRIVHKLRSQLLEGDAGVAQLQRAADAHDWRVSHGAGRDWVLRELYP